MALFADDLNRHVISVPRLFHANFEFEHELAGRAGDVNAAVRRLAADFSVAWLPLAQPGDFVLIPRGIQAEPHDGVSYVDDPRALAGRDLEFVPWGWTESVLAMARKHGWRTNAPPLEVVRQVNHRAFRFELEQELGVALPGSRRVATIQEAVAGIAAIPGAWWVLKAGYGMAGREQWRGRGSMESPARAAITRRMAASGSFVLEPWLRPLAEAGVQIEIPQAGRPRLLGVVPQLVDQFGVYRGSRFGADEDWRPWQPAVDVALKVAERLQALGYFGPLGIDAMRHESRGESLLRPLQDLNARWTMGRAAWGISRKLVPGECGSWLLVRWSDARGDFHEWTESLGPQLPAGVRLSELCLHSQSFSTAEVPNRFAARHFTLVVVAPDPDSRRLAESLVLTCQPPVS